MSKRHSGLIYLSGPMTGYVDDNAPAFNYVARVLREHDFLIVNPAELGRADYFTWEDYLKRDIRFMLECTGVIFLPKSNDSRGATLEIQLARDLGYPVWALRDFLVSPENGFPHEGLYILNWYLKLSVLCPG